MAHSMENEDDEDKADVALGRRKGTKRSRRRNFRFVTAIGKYRTGFSPEYSTYFWIFAYLPFKPWGIPWSPVVKLCLLSIQIVLSLGWFKGKFTGTPHI